MKKYKEIMKKYEENWKIMKELLSSNIGRGT